MKSEQESSETVTDRKMHGALAVCQTTGNDVVSLQEARVIRRSNQPRGRAQSTEYEFNSSEETNTFWQTPSHDLRRAQTFYASSHTVILPGFSADTTWLLSLCIWKCPKLEMFPLTWEWPEMESLQQIPIKSQLKLCFFLDIVLLFNTKC